MELPIYCYSCGALLQNGATEHSADCAILALILKRFPDATVGAQQRAIECAIVGRRMMAN